MTGLLLILVTAFTLVVAITPGFRSLARRIGSVDQPGEKKIHRQAIPLLGGVGLYIAVIVAILLFGQWFFIRQAVGILIGGTLMSFTGLWDDHRNLAPSTKLFIQLVASVVVIATGIQIELFNAEWQNIVVTVIWIVVVSNSFNLIDNMDGLSAGLAAIASLFFLVLSALNGQYLVGMLSAATLGGCLGFLFYNFNPATIFMGDAGSLFIGFIIAATGIKLRFPENTPLVTWMVPVIVLAVPLFDTLFVTVSRTARGQSILVGGKDHVSHRLLSTTGSERRVVFRLHMIAVVSGLAAVFISFASVRPAYIIAGILAATAVFCYVFMIKRG